MSAVGRHQPGIHAVIDGVTNVLSMTVPKRRIEATRMLANWIGVAGSPDHACRFIERRKRGAAGIPNDCRAELSDLRRIGTHVPGSQIGVLGKGQRGPTTI